MDKLVWNTNLISHEVLVDPFNGFISKEYKLDPFNEFVSKEVLSSSQRKLKKPREKCTSLTTCPSPMLIQRLMTTVDRRVR